ncbi:helix-turn-helix domain-containing protein [Ferrimonas balearica]|uniref:helix-turn-helix domain-containing protein n=1 Tax=Ferrimonas balearica TaxID=44012 RepID=UPI001C999223|nr:hypothetical protein [Ferrimonas balearica]MBY5992344.1 hypothetical protein [Ferrimonas balearica]
MALPTQPTEASLILDKAMAETGLSVAQVAALFNVHPESIRRWRRGNVQADGPALAMLRAMLIAKLDVRAMIALGDYNQTLGKESERPPEEALESLLTLRKQLRD